MTDHVAGVEKTEKDGGASPRDDRLAGCRQPEMTLAERANLARNLYALNDWLRNHLQP